MTVKNTLIVLLVALAVVACTTIAPPPGREAATITTDMLLGVSPIATKAANDLTGDVDILELSPEMIEFLDRHVNRNAGEYSRMLQLLDAVVDEGDFNLVYDDKTRTAMETFSDRRGNCLSFTNMFIAMARHLGLEAIYQEVEIPPDWSAQGQSFILSRHINVLLDFGWNKERVVDFNIDEFESSYEVQRVSDERARAHHFNNLGVEEMLSGNNGAALSYFRLAAEADSHFTPIWINLGALYRREGLPVYAEASYLNAIRMDSKSLVAMSNLARLYEQQGEDILAERYLKRAEKHRMRNPYYRYKLAREAFESREYEEAIDHMKVAVRYKKNVDSFYYLLGLSYFKAGDQKSGERWISRAAESVEKNELKEAYNSKLERLLSSN